MSKFSMKVAVSTAILGGIVASAVSASAALNLPTQSCTFKFNQNMKLNSRGADVMNLQKVLNGWSQTQVAASGAGSPGMEITNFGPATRAAVIKFQDKHLAELGITSGTGNVFAGTRGLLNEVCGSSVSTNPGTTTTYPAGCTSASGFSPVTGASCASGAVTTYPAGCTSASGFSPVTGASCASGAVTTPGTAVSVSAALASSQPMGMVAAPSAAALLANLSFTGNGTVTNVELQRIGLSNDSALTNVYLYEGNTRITDAASVVTGGYIRFNSASGLFTVNGSRTISVRADLDSTAAGSAVGVKLNSLTTLGGSAVTFSNVMGPVFTASTVTPATVSFQQVVNNPALTPEAGVTNYAVWRGTANVSLRDVNLRAATFKFVGLAPVDSVANLSLYVDGAKVAGPSLVNAANNNKVTFDLGNTPFVLRTGSHPVELRGDVVKGSDRSATFSIENNADLMFEDTGLVGVNISAKDYLGASFQQQSYATLNIKSGSIIINQDAAFTSNKVTGGASNMPIAQFTLKAFGEDVKVSTLRVTPNLLGMTPAAYGLTNVGLFLNNAQIGSSQNWTATGTNPTLSFTLGSSLIIPAGQTVTLTVKSDIKTVNSVTYTGGTVSADIAAAIQNANGVTSSKYFDFPSAVKNGQTLTVSSGVGAFSRTAGFTDQNVAPNTNNVKIGSFTIQAGSAEDTIVNGATVDLVFSNSTLFGTSNVSNLTLKDGSTALGTPTSGVSTSNNFSFGDVTVPMNSTKTFDVYADLSSYSGSETVKANMTLSTRGPVSGTTANPVATGVFTTATAATLAAPTLVSSSMTSQYQVGGTSVAIASFKLKTASGNAATVRQMNFSVTGTDAIESVTVGTNPATPVVGSVVTVTGLSLPISSTGYDVPVSVKFAGFKNSTLGGSLTGTVPVVNIVLNYVEAISGTQVISTTTAATSSNMVLVASKPTVLVSSVQGSGLSVGENKIGEVTVTADNNGKIALKSLDFTTTLSGITGATLTGCKLTDGSTAAANGSTVGACTTSSAIINFAGGYEIAANTAKTFSLYATIGGTLGTSGQSAVSTKLTSGATFVWDDVIGNGVNLTGADIYNFPTNSYTVKN